MLRRIAVIISYVFHPLLMATLLVAILYFYAPSILRPINTEVIRPVLLMVFIITYAIPVLSVGVLKLTKSISSMHLEKREERLVPFAFITSFYGLLVYFFMFKLDLGNAFPVLFGSITVIILLATIITVFYKISVHSAGITGLLGFLISIHFKLPDSQLFWPILIVLVLAGVVNSSRLYLSVHNPAQVALGSLLGFSISFVSILIFI